MKKFLSRLLVIIPPLILGLLVGKYGIDILYYDEWHIFGADSVGHNLGHLTWSHIFNQHNESRKFFPRLLTVAFSSLTSWNTRYGMVISIFLACLVSFNIYCLSKITLKANQAKRLVLLAMANLLIFSPLQWENWLWGLQCITFVPIAVITSALVVIFAQNSLLIKFVCSVLLATLATFSFANGMISWIVIFPALIFAAYKTKRSLILMAGGWLFFGALAFAIYFHDYSSPANHPSLTKSLAQPLSVVLYFLAFLGSPLGVEDLISSQIIGFCLLSLLALICFYLYKINPRTQLFWRAFPWLCIVSYSLGSGILTATGRLSLGIDLALGSRYVTFSTYAIVGLIYLLAIVAEDSKSLLDLAAQKQLKYLKYLQIFKRITALLIVGLLLIFPANFAIGLNQMQINHKNKLYGKSCLSLIYVIRNEQCLQQYLFPDPQFIVDKAAELDRLGLIRPPLVLGKTMQSMTSPSVFEQMNYGFFDTLTSEENSNYTASGWSVIPQYRRTADAVILAYQTKDNLDHPFALVQPLIARPDVVQADKVSGYKDSGWSHTFAQNLIPEDAIAISAWAYDSQIARAYKLETIHPAALGNQLKSESKFKSKSS